MVCFLNNNLVTGPVFNVWIFYVTVSGGLIFLPIKASSNITLSPSYREQVSLTLTQVQINILTLSRLSFGKQNWLKVEFQIKVLNLIPKKWRTDYARKGLVRLHNSFCYMYALFSYPPVVFAAKK